MEVYNETGRSIKHPRRPAKQNRPIEKSAEVQRQGAGREVIVYRINRTNMQTVHEGETLTQMIARKDTLKLRLTVMRDLLKHVVENDRYGRQEIKYVRTVDVGELRKVTDNYSKQLRNLDMKLQSLNWSVDLI